MPDTASVAIIGAGAVGLASALHLARRGITNVVVLEASHVAAGSSGLSVGIIETQYVDPLDIELRARSMELFRRLEDDHDLHVTHNGYLRLARTEEVAAGFARSVELQRGLGITDACVLEPEQIGALVPDMRTDDVCCGLFGPRDGFLDGHVYCELLAQLAREHGVRILQDRRVARAGVDSRGRHVLEAGCDTVTSRFVVNAAGPWADQVARTLGYQMPLLRQRHQAVVVHLVRELTYMMPSVMDYTPRSGRSGLYFRHERPGQLIAGLHTEEVTGFDTDPDECPRSADQEFIETVASLMCARLPSLADAGLAHGWGGVYPISPDGLPQVGPVEGDPTLIAAGGVGGSGIQLSPVVGELVADWIIEGEPRCIDGGWALAPSRASLVPARRGACAGQTA